MKVGELCAGYNGLGMAVEAVFNAEPAWFSEFDAAPSKILAHHYPEVPNYGDMTKIDWASMQQADIISGGTPCQDLSAAGRRAGMTEGTRSNLWVQMREAIAIQRPRFVVWENVRGAYSAGADSEVEQCPGCLGDAGDGKHLLRALGRVLGDLSDLGYDCQWRGLRAADVGAPHGRFRVFVLAQDSNLTAGCERGLAAPGQAQGRRPWPDAGGRGGASVAGSGYVSTSTPWWAESESATDADNPGRGEQRRAFTVRPEHPTTEHPSPDAADANGGTGGWRADSGSSGGRQAEVQGGLAPDAESIGRGEGRAESAGILRGLATASDSPLAPDSNDSAGNGERSRPEPGQGDQDAANSASARRAKGEDGGTGGDDEGQGAWRGEPERVGGERTGIAPDSISGGCSRRPREARRETRERTAVERASEGSGATSDDTSAARRGSEQHDLSAPAGSASEPGELAGEVAWGEYEPAIRRWERSIGRAAPRPTEPTGRNGGHRLSPRFTEWMMGLPDGWVTDPAIGISRNEQLKACGNGVVPQQAMAALQDMLNAFQNEGIAA